MFNRDNTSGYTDAELVLLNDRVTRRLNKMLHGDNLDVIQHTEESVLREFDTERENLADIVGRY